MENMKSECIYCSNGEGEYFGKEFFKMEDKKRPAAEKVRIVNSQMVWLDGSK